MVNYDLTIILLPLKWDTQALSLSLDSIAKTMQESGLRIECLCAEMLPNETNVGNLQTTTIQALPPSLQEYLQYEDFNYLVEYGSTSRGLRRAIRCAKGNYVCFLREGDQIGFRLAGEKALGKDDVTIGACLANADSLTAHTQLANCPSKIKNLSAMAALLGSYDSALIIRREFLDQALGRISEDSERGYPYFLNRLLWQSIIASNGDIGFTDQFAIHPCTDNLNQHVKQLRNLNAEKVYSKVIVNTKGLEPGTLLAVKLILYSLVDALKSCAAGASSLDVLPKLASLGLNNAPFHKENLSSSKNFHSFLNWAGQCASASCHGDETLPRSSTLPVYAEIKQDSAPKVSIISSAFRAQGLIFSFLSNLAELSDFNEYEILIVSPVRNTIQSIVTELFGLLLPNIYEIKLDSDPGLYECWNIAIKESKGKYVTNANLDDRRYRDHIRRIVSVMEETQSDVGSAAVAITQQFGDIAGFSSEMLDSRPGKKWDAWYAYAESGHSMKSLLDFFVFNSDGSVKQCMNFPHCMPIWRRELHEELGYFNEQDNGTYADFAMWLDAASKKKTFVHLNDVLGLYLVDQNSHNRSNANQKIWERIVQRHLPKDKQLSVPEHCQIKNHELPTDSNLKGWQDRRKLNFGKQFSQNFGRHRSGWTYALSTLKDQHDESAPVFCETFVEKKFVWGGDPGDASSTEPQAIATPWVGFIHVPPTVPSWFQFEQSNEQVFRSSLWKRSAGNCKGLFCLTDYHRRYLQDLLKPDFPISVLYHPTEIPEIRFDFARYLENPAKRLVQVGWWLRKLNAISKVNIAGHTSTILGASDWSKNIISYSERRYYGLTAPASADVIDFLDNDAYDRLLAENIVFIDFYDTSANNAVIECIARATPILVCRHPAVEEYLGTDYPLFYESYAEIPKMLKDQNRILAAIEILQSSEVSRKIEAKNFVKQFMDSEVLKNAYA